MLKTYFFTYGYIHHISQFNRAYCSYTTYLQTSMMYEIPSHMHFIREILGFRVVITPGIYYKPPEKDV